MKAGKIFRNAAQSRFGGMGRAAVWAAFCCMLLLSAGCGGKQNEEAAVKSKEHVYRSEAVDIEEIQDGSSINDIQVRNGRIYITAYHWVPEEEGGGTTLRIFSQDLDGTDRKVTQLDVADDSSYSQIIPDGEGNYFSIWNHYYEDDSDPDNYIWVDEYYLVKLDGAGNELWKQRLTGENPDAYWVEKMLLLEDGRILLSDTDGLSLYDAEGSRTGEVKLQKGIDSYSLFQAGDGKVVLRYYSPESGKDLLNELNVDTGELSQDYSLPGGSGGYGVMYPGKGYDFLVVGDGSIYGYNLGDTEMTEMMNFIDSDLMNYYINCLFALSETEFYGVVDDEDGESVLTKFTKVDPKDVKDKIVLTLGCNGFDWDIRTQVVAFNKASEEYRITVEDYSKYNTDEDYTIGFSRLNTDIASGKVPDILMLQSDMPVDSYISKGLFEDLYPYIDKDEAMAREDFFPNVLSLYETDGKLYRIAPSFTVFTVSGKTADVGPEPGWSLEDLYQVMAGKPEGTQVFSEMTRGNLMSYGMQMSGEQFIDWKTGKCSFDSEEFIGLLKFAGQFPEELDEDYYGENFWENYDSLWREGRVLLEPLYLSGFSSYNFDKKGTFGEDITLIGFPGSKGNGAALSGNMEMAMSSKSGNKDGAWQFMRYFLTEEYQGKMDYQWPLSLEQAEKLGQEAMKTPTYEDIDGNIVEEDQTYMVGGVEVTITPMSREEVDGLLAYVKTVNQFYSNNEALLNIVMEEAEPYFAGQKKAEEVAGIIQSRVQIYVNENR